MRLSEREYPVPYNPTWEIFDASKLKDYLDCPRAFFWRYVLGWKSDAPNNHLIFGEAMHRALAYLMQTEYTPERVIEAYNTKFLPYYRKYFPASTDELMGAKTPEGMIKALGNYIGEYQHDLKEFEVHHVEVAITVPITSEYVLHGRIDAICEDDKGFFAMEHKSGSGISRFWTDQWELDLQPATYTHALRAAFPRNNVRGVKINGVHFKNLKAGPKIEFIRLPIWKDNEQMLTWLATVTTLIDQISIDFDMLSRETADDAVMTSFRLNPNSCTKYFGCPYHDFCCAWANPISRCQQLQTGFKIDFWDPRELEAQYQLVEGEVRKKESQSE